MIEDFKIFFRCIKMKKKEICIYFLRSKKSKILNIAFIQKKYNHTA